MTTENLGEIQARIAEAQAGADAATTASPPVQPADKGPWKVAVRGNGEVVLESDDFVHDVVLVVEGDFERSAQAKEYAALLAHQMNSAQPVQPLVTTDQAGVFCQNIGLINDSHNRALILSALVVFLGNGLAQPVQPGPKGTS